MDENSIVSWRLGTSEYPEIFFSPAKPSNLNIFNKMWFQEFYVSNENENFQFLKNKFC